MKKYISLIALCMMIPCLSACHSVTSEVNKEMQNELTAASIETEKALKTDERLAKIDNFQQIVEITTSKGEFSLESPFSGKIYLMATKENLEKLSKEEFTLNEKSFSTIDAGSSSDFNIRYKHQTYFTIQSLSVQDLEDFEYTKSSSTSAILVFYPD
ncbi:hypothetical protein K6V96_08315 [Streptococcus suis]|uniref:hypothetical protein n=1 Tax=Streptococcus suis TaxID=1307 RepID=UPI000492981B|nr:hypothetical protein [Streptococcus suis]AUC90765.1 hypothetical protein CWM22_01915 [Streptococcus suis]MBY5015041.1 hypothetical protein [Streptococcus suis]MBY5030510.1 hypothetical protein [Streptococcus suis]MBY5032987.1 hypothetical protein [Streptococcus suis]MBY5037502.1 hypothetical protein [Streptococcus suis]